MAEFPQDLVIDLLQQDQRVYAAFMSVLLVLGAAQYFLGPKQDWVEDYRTRYWVKLHEILTLVGFGAIGESHDVEYVATLPISKDEIQSVDTEPEDVAERKLYRMGFHRNFLAAYKHRVTGGVREESEGSWVKRDSLLAPWQLHATIYKGEDPWSIDVYVHKEYSNITHPFKHFAGDGQQYDAAKRDFKRLLDKHGIDYTER